MHFVIGLDEGDSIENSAEERKPPLRTTAPWAFSCLSAITLVAGLIILAFGIVISESGLIGVGAFVLLLAGLLLIPRYLFAQTLRIPPKPADSILISKSTDVVMVDLYSPKRPAYRFVIQFRGIGESGLGQDQRLKISVSEEIFNKYEEGDTIPVLYLPADPRRAILKDEKFPLPVWEEYRPASWDE